MFYLNLFPLESCFLLSWSKKANSAGECSKSLYLDINAPQIRVTPPEATMCWITLNPKRRKHHHNHHRDHDQDPSVEHLIQRNRVSFDVDAPIPTTLYPSHHHHQQERIRIVTPEPRHHHPHTHVHHRHHHHIRPLHLHSTKLHGPGKKRAPPAPPPPSREPSRSRRSRSRDALYRIQPISVTNPPYRVVIAEPETEEIRETTRIALRESRPRERRLRRVAGYEVLGREVPWSWDCVSSVDGRGRETGTGRRGGGGLRYPPFGESEDWM